MIDLSFKVLTLYPNIPFGSLSATYIDKPRKFYYNTSANTSLEVKTTMRRKPAGWRDFLEG